VFDPGSVWGPVHSSRRVGDNMEPKRVFLTPEGVTPKGEVKGFLRLLLRGAGQACLRTAMAPP
jgi:hypothetical protein